MAGSGSVRPFSTSPARILVVDDEPVLRRYICRVLESAGYLTLEAGDGRGALDLLEQPAGEPPVSMVVSDVMMPGMDGIELEQAVHRRWPDVPVLLMSGRITREVLADEGVRPAPLLSKPFSPDQLVTAVRHVLQT